MRDGRPSTQEMPVGSGDAGPDEPTVVAPPLSATPVRAARARPTAPTGGAVASPRPAPVAAGRPAPPSLTPAPAGPVVPPTAAETTAARVSPWPHAASPFPPAPPVPALVPGARAAGATAAIPVAAGAPTPAPVEEPAVDPGPGTSPSFAIRHAGAVSFGRSLPTPREHASGRHAVPDEHGGDETAPRRHRHRRSTDTLEQPAVPAMAGAPTATRRHRAPSRRRAS